MLKHLSFRSLAVLFLMAFGFNSAFSQAAFFTEKFADDAAFAKWTNAQTGAGAVKWVRSTDALANMGFDPALATAFSSPSAADGFAFYNSDLNGQGNTHDATLTYGPIDCASHTSVGIRFHSQFAHFLDAGEPKGSTVEVRVSTDGGTTWTAYTTNLESEASVGFAQQDKVLGDITSAMGIPAANGKAQVWIQFRWNGTYEYGWKLDDIELYDFTAPKTSVTFAVNMALVTVDPAGAKIAGSFTNWADADMVKGANGVYTYTTDLDAGSEVLWKYKNGPNGWENVTAACGKSDGFGGFNRVLTVPAAATTLSAVCLGSCDPCKLPCNLNPDALICDNFDSYDATKKLAAQSPTNWSTWSNAPGGAEDGIVSKEQANTPTQSLKVAGTAQDVILKLGNRTTGRYSLKYNYYIPTGKLGYYNIQEAFPLPSNPPPSGNWNLDVYFRANGQGDGSVSGAVAFKFTYPYNKWFNIEHIIDLDNNLLKFYIDGKLAGGMAYPDNLGGIDFYGPDANGQQYIDDVEFIKLPSVTFNADICDQSVDLTPYFGGAPGVAVTTPLQNNTAAGTSAADPDAAALCFQDLADGTNVAPKIDKSMWYNFPGDGNKYNIKTVKCNATNYINYNAVDPNNPGDSQIAIFSGNDCKSLTLADCNEDIDFAAANYAAGLTFQTTAGTNYFMMIDGYNLDGTVATGEYCIEITRVSDILCAAGKVGTFTLEDNGFVCRNDELADLITLGPATGFVIPNVGPTYGFAWALTTTAIPANTWPNTVAGLLTGATGFNSNAPFVISLPNDGDPFAAGQYFLTPIVAAGITDGNPATAGTSLFDGVVGTGGCFFLGTSRPIFLMPDAADIDPIGGSIVQTGNTLNLTPTGGTADYAGDPSFYVYNWSNGATTQDITVTTGGTYTVTISDISDCGIAPKVVSFTTAAQDPQSVKNLTVSPNPSTGNFNFTLNLEAPAQVRADIVNSIGQVVRTMDFGKVSNLNQAIQLDHLSSGTYFMHINIDGEKTYRSLLIQK